MRDAFVSHSSIDRPVADSVYTTLETAGLSGWMAPRDIEPGTMWGDQIMKAIRSCRSMVVVFSRHANQSNQVRREVNRAADRDVPILPFRIEDCEPTDLMELFLSNQHWLNAFTEPIEEHLGELAEAVRAIAAASAEIGEHLVDHDLAAANAAALVEAADNEDPAAATTLGLRARDRGDYDEALRRLLEGAEGDDAMAATTLGLMARERDDHHEALKWFTKGAKGDDVMAATNLGLLAHERGDTDEALRWLRQGADGGDELAGDELVRLLGER